jgi:hypothetical protein
VPATVWYTGLLREWRKAGEDPADMRLREGDRYVTMARASRVLHIVPLLVAVCFVGSPAQAKYGGGTGHTGNPYLIYTAEQMNAIGTEPNDWDKHFKLMADIDLSQYAGERFNVIGYFERVGEDKPFTGVFDGNGKTVSNFTYISADEGGNAVSQQSDKDGLGIFGYARWAVIKDLVVADPNIIVVDGEFVVDGYRPGNTSAG